MYIWGKEKNVKVIKLAKRKLRLIEINNLLKLKHLKFNSNSCLSIIFLFFILLFCNSCSTKANKGTISGTVTLFNDIPDYYIENPMDFSGVTVALYKTAVLDTTLVRINQQYPQIGVQITQETEFDHRNFNPLKVVTTDAEGTFSFPSLTPGNYNLVVWKNEWGIRYICSVRAEEKENNNLGNIELYPATSYNSPIVSEPTIFKSDHSYFIRNDINFMSSVEFQSRAQIFINPACIVKFYGAITTPEFTSSRDMWKITSGKEIYSTSQVTMDFDSYYSAVTFYGAEINLKSGVVRYGSSGISTANTNSNYINYVVFRNCGTALTVIEGNLDAGYLVCSNCNNSGIEYTSNNIEENRIASITRCIIINNSQRGISIVRAGNYNINNCYINNNYYAIYIRDCNGYIENNEFNLSSYHIYYHKNCSHNEVHYNNFYNTTIGLTLRGSINNINNNNFFCVSTYYIYILYSAPPYSLVNSDVNAINNYWRVEEVSRYLADAEDDPKCPYYINFLPRLLNPVQKAGIQ